MASNSLKDTFRALMGPKAQQDEAMQQEKVYFPAAVPFTNLEHEAASWNNNVVQKFFALKLELPTYLDIIRSSAITGRDMLSWHPKFPDATYDQIQPIHKLKVNAHCQRLRDLVIAYGKSHRPKRLDDWEVQHVASWIHVEQGDPMAALTALRGNWTGHSLRDVVVHHGGAKGWPSLAPTQQEQLLAAITRLVDANPGDEAAAPPPPSAADATGAKSKKKLRKKKGKKETALNKRKDTLGTPAAALRNPSDPTAKPEDGDHDDGDDDDDNDADVKEVPLPSYSEVVDNKPSKSAKDPARPTSAGTPSATSDVVYHFDRSARPGSAPEAVKPTTRLKSIRAAAASSKTNNSKLNLDEDGHLDHDEDEEEELLVIPISSKSKPSSSKKTEESSSLPSAELTKERDAFLKQIHGLQSTVAQHADTIQRLQQEVLRWQKEKDNALHDRVKLQQQHGASKQVVQELLRDRALAASEMEKLTALYSQQSNRHEAALGAQVSALQRDVQQTQRENEQLRRSQSSSASAPLAAHPLESQIANHTYPSGVVLMPTTPGATTTLSSSMQPQATSMSTSLNNHKTEDDDSDLDSVHNLTATVPPPTAAAPRSSNTQVPSTPTTATTPAANANAATENVGSMLQMMQQSARQDLLQWRQTLQVYRFPKLLLQGLSPGILQDTRQLMLQVVVRWQAVGRRMLSDIQSSSTASCLSCLKALKQCALKLLEGSHRHYHTHVRLSSGRLSSKSHRSSTAHDHKSTFTQKLTLASTTTSSSTAGASSPPSSPSKSRHHRPTPLEDDHCSYTESALCCAMVYALACVQRVLHRFPDISPIQLSQPQYMELSSFFHALRLGDLPTTSGARSNSALPSRSNQGSSSNHTPALTASGERSTAEISRDNLRDYIDQQLGLDLPWDKYDSVAQRVDRNRTGFVTFSEVLHAFWSLHPSVLSFHTFCTTHLHPGSQNASSSLSPPPEMVQTAWPLVVLWTFTLCSEYILNTIVPHHSPASDPNQRPPHLSLSEQWLHLFTSPTHNKASAIKFARYLQEAQAQAAKNKRTRAEAMMEDDSSAARAKALLTDRHVVHDQAFVAGLLLECTKDSWDMVNLVYDHLPDLKKRYFSLYRQLPKDTQPLAHTTTTSAPPALITPVTPATLTAAATQSSNAPAALIQHVKHMWEHSWLLRDHLPTVHLQQQSTSTSSSSSTSGAVYAHTARSVFDYFHEHYPRNQEEITLHIAHGLYIYDPVDTSSHQVQQQPQHLQGDVLGHFSDIMYQFMHLRQCAQQHLSPTPSIPSSSTTSDKAASTTSSSFASRLSLFSTANPSWTPMPASSSLSHTWIQQLSEKLGMPLLSICEEDDISCDSNNNNKGKLPMLVYWQMMLEELLRDCQSIVSTDADILSSQVVSTSTSGAYHDKPASISTSTKRDKPAELNSAVWQDLQRAVHADLWASGQAPPPPANAAGGMHIPAAGEHGTTNSRMISEVDKVLAQQRVEHVTKYLDTLNHRAIKKKQILSTLLSLWQSTKLSLQHEHHQESSASSDQKKWRDRAYGMPVSEILVQTRSIQGTLVKDMQAPTNTKLALLEDKVELLRRGLETGEILDNEEGVLGKALLEVDSIRSSLLLANNDAMRLSARILQHLEPLTQPAKK